VIVNDTDQEGIDEFKCVRQNCHTVFKHCLLLVDRWQILLFGLLLGIAHRDLKPDNILCVHSDQLVPVKLIDFDLASSFMLDGNGSDVVTTPRLRSPVSSHLCTKSVAVHMIQLFYSIL